MAVVTIILLCDSKKSCTITGHCPWTNLHISKISRTALCTKLVWRRTKRRCTYYLNTRVYSANAKHDSLATLFEALGDLDFAFGKSWSGSNDIKRATTHNVGRFHAWRRSRKKGELTQKTDQESRNIKFPRFFVKHNPHAVCVYVN